MFEEVREPDTQKLAFRYDPDEGKIEIKRRGATRVFDLNKIKARIERDRQTRPEPLDVASDT